MSCINLFNVIEQVKGLLWGFCFFTLPLSAQDCPTKNGAAVLLERRTLDAFPAEGEHIRIDGVLNESSWTQARAATRFSQISPEAGAESRLETEARVLYASDALYVGMRLYDNPGMIVAPFIRRDDETNCDWAFAEIDSRHDYRSGFSFGLNPRGVQTDGAWMNDTIYDSSWDGVWEGAAAIDERGWTAEFRIPLSQLPYRATSGKVVWGINFYRFSPRHGESSVWAPRVPWQAGVVSRFNQLHLETPESRRRVEVTPFTAAGVRNDGAGRVSFRGGADLRLGLGSAFWVSAAVLPDFGQVEADPDQLNLTTFELFQKERRPFFVQGLDAFRFDSSLKFTTRENSFLEETPFYSRRIGRAPRGETPPETRILRMPNASTILAAVKVSGQTASLWNVGGFAATTQNELADLRDAQGKEFSWAVEPMSQVELLRLSKSSPANTYSLGMIFGNKTNLRLGDELRRSVVRSAIIAGVDGRYRFESGEYEMAGWLVSSRLTGDPEAILKATQEPHHFFQRPDASYLHNLGKNGRLSGIAAQARLSRIGGSFRWDLSAEAISPGYDVNEIGFQRNSDWLLLAGAWLYESFPSNRFIRHWVTGSDSLGLGWNWAGETRARTLDGFFALDTRNYWNASVSWAHDFSALSTEWLHGGPGLVLPSRDSFRCTILSDQRRTSFAQFDGTFTREAGTGSGSWTLNPQMYFWDGTHFRWSLGLTYQQDTVGWQYIAKAQPGTGGTFLVARDRQRTLSPTLRADWAFSPHLVLQIYAQPFVSSGQFDRYQQLINPRASAINERFDPLSSSQITHDPTTHTTSADLNGDGTIDSVFPTPDNMSRTSNASVILRWEYRPGSFLTAVWNHRSDVTVPLRGKGLAAGLRQLLSDPASEVFLVKLSYYFSR